MKTSIEIKVSPKFLSHVLAYKVKTILTISFVSFSVFFFSFR